MIRQKLQKSAKEGDVTTLDRVSTNHEAQHNQVRSDTTDEDGTFESMLSKPELVITF